MEKQPVDDLFARKLREAEAPVGPDVFSQLQKRMGGQPEFPVRRPVVAWWHVASAACLLIALWFLYVTNKTENHISVPIARKQDQPKIQNDSTDNEAIAATTLKSASEHRGREVTSGSVAEPKQNNVTAQVTYPTRRNVYANLPDEPKSDERTPVRASETERIAAMPRQIGSPVTEQITATTTPTPVERIAQVSNTQKRATERTVLLTIEEPQPASSLATVESQITALDAQQPHQHGLSGLFGKLKQLKNGEVMAKAAPVNSENNQKNRLGRVFSEVKESLKNETTLE